MSYLSVTELSKSYGKVPALSGFSLEIERGQIFALVGPDGAGKTTLLRILCRLIDADSGSGSVDGKDIFRQFAEIKTLLGYMPQNFSLYPDLSVEENLEFYAGLHGVTGSAYRAKRDYLYGFSNLGPFAKRRSAALSGGMKQKLALSCALVHEPQLLILDEPTTGVDPLSRRQFWEILLNLRSQGTTILVSTPYMDEVARADRACFIDRGKKLSEGTPERLARDFTQKIYFLDELPSLGSIEKIGAIPGVSARRFGAGLHIYIGGTETVEQYAPRLREAGVDPARLTVAQPGLEDRFIELMEVNQ